MPDQNLLSLNMPFVQNNSIVVSVIIISLIVIMLVSIFANCWLRNKKTRIMPKDAWIVSNKYDRPTTLLTRPALAFNRETTLPVYRKSDTWEAYVKMIQTPDKLNDVVHSMKVHTPSCSVISLNHFKNDNTTDRKSNYTQSPLRKDHSNSNDDDN